MSIERTGLLTKWLTAGETDWEARALVTHPGQAHLAEIGLGLTCRECVHWDSRRTLAYPRTAGGELQPMRCQKAVAMMGRSLGVPPVPHVAWACKYFEPNEKPPAATIVMEEVGA